jgi:Peptidase_C39 like family
MKALGSFALWVVLGATAAPALAALPTTIAAANANHKTQFYHPTYNPDGPSSSQNCGPTSVAMIVKALGAETPGISGENSIDHARYLEFAPSSTGWDTSGRGVRVLNQDLTDTSTTNAETAFANLGGWSENGSTSANLSTKLDEGKPAIVAGVITQTWKNQFPTPSLYCSAASGTGHLIAVVGKLSDGRFIVSDPCYKGGAAGMTASQLGSFNGGSIVFHAAAGIGRGVGAVFMNASTLRSGVDWDFCHGKATCAYGETVGGMSEVPGGYGHAAYCRRGGTREMTGNIVRTLNLDQRASVRSVNGNADWAAGYLKLELRGHYRSNRPTLWISQLSSSAPGQVVHP